LPEVRLYPLGSYAYQHIMALYYSFQFLRPRKEERKTPKGESGGTPNMPARGVSTRAYFLCPRAQEPPTCPHTLKFKVVVYLLLRSSLVAAFEVYVGYIRVVAHDATIGK
jgi:hypothetical protein